ncbi:hypothetical protein [Anaerobiospirillum sp. NML120511]|uniref:hypothetical protein n=1 Tax=Anaerobiospirillum sp. NML120511 TaxID=2932819 RepID=UPI001FF60FED|nr:hypothetical protein [Anaerobiospirillum sp. NML120511]MCK0535210.1 hypothetical protein [Anaerobiospirillum sp. NML120511]
MSDSNTASLKLSVAGTNEWREKNKEVNARLDAEIEGFYREKANKIAANELLAAAALKRIDANPALALEAGKHFNVMYRPIPEIGFDIPEPTEMPRFIEIYKKTVSDGTIPSGDKRSFEAVLAKFELEQRAKEAVSSKI